MSNNGAIEQINDYPLGDDSVTMRDPKTPPDVVPGPGDHADEDGGSITHLPEQIRGRQLSASDLIEFGKRGWEKHRHGEFSKGLDPDAAFASGTDQHPDRDIRDDALQVRDLKPTSGSNNTIAVTSPIPVSVAPKRPERMSMIVKNAGADTAYIGIGGSGNALPGYGFPLSPGDTLILSMLDGVFASVEGGDSTSIAVLEQFRTDNGAN